MSAEKLSDVLLRLTPERAAGIARDALADFMGGTVDHDAMLSRLCEIRAECDRQGVEWSRVLFWVRP